MGEHFQKKAGEQYQKACEHFPHRQAGLGSFYNCGLLKKSCLLKIAWI